MFIIWHHFPLRPLDFATSWLRVTRGRCVVWIGRRVQASPSQEEHSLRLQAHNPLLADNAKYSWWRRKIWSTVTLLARCMLLTRSRTKTSTWSESWRSSDWSCRYFFAIVDRLFNIMIAHHEMIQNLCIFKWHYFMCAIRTRVVIVCTCRTTLVTTCLRLLFPVIRYDNLSWIWNWHNQNMLHELVSGDFIERL